MIATLAGLGLALAIAVRAILPGHVSVISWPAFPDDPGGWSGLDVSVEGDRFWMIGDNGDWAEGTVQRAPDGRMTGARVPRAARLLQPDGRPLARPWHDTEGLAIGPDGSFYISREWQHSVDRRPSLSSRPTLLPRAPAFYPMPGNVGLEAVAVDVTGAVYTLQERPGPLATTLPLFRLAPDASTWEVAATLPREGFWSISGADFAPGGALYLLERRFLGVGFASRIRRVDLHPDGPHVAMVYRSLPGRHGNLEGLGIWQDPEGRLRALMVSDNNRLALQRQQLVEVILPPLP